MASNAKFCSQCGNELPEPNPPFCSQCGTKINVVITATPPIETDSIISAPQRESLPQRVSFRRAIELGFRGYVDFSGRSSRAEYWWWILFLALGGCSLLILDAIIFYQLGWTADVYMFGPFNNLFTIAMFLPTVAVMCRRFHDINHTVLLAWILAGFQIILFIVSWLPDYDWSTDSGIVITLTLLVTLSVGVIGSLIVFFLASVLAFAWAVSKGHETTNQYGPPVYSQTE